MEYQQASGTEDDVQKIRQDIDKSYYWWNVELTLHFSPCCTYNSGYKSPEKNKVKGPHSLKLGHPMLSLSLSLYLSFFIHWCRPSWGYPWTLLRLDLGSSACLLLRLSRPQLCKPAGPSLQLMWPPPRLVSSRTRSSKDGLVLSCSVASDREHMGCSPPGSSVHGIFLAGIPKWVAMSYSRASSRYQGSNPGLLCLLHWRLILYCWATREAWNVG